jgi:hypothetical protein
MPTHKLGMIVTARMSQVTHVTHHTLASVCRVPALLGQPKKPATGYFVETQGTGINPKSKKGLQRRQSPVQQTTAPPSQHQLRARR